MFTCPECGQSFSSQQGLASHTRVHKKGRNKGRNTVRNTVRNTDVNSYKYAYNTGNEKKGFLPKNITLDVDGVLDDLFGKDSPRYAVPRAGEKPVQSTALVPQQTTSVVPQNTQQGTCQPASLSCQPVTVTPLNYYKSGVNIPTKVVILGGLVFLGVCAMVMVANQSNGRSAKGAGAMTYLPAGIVAILGFSKLLRTELKGWRSELTSLNKQLDKWIA